MGYLTRSFLDSLNRQGWMQQSLYRSAASELGLSENGFWVLYILSDMERQYTQQALCSEWRFSKQTVNSTVQVLAEKHGLDKDYVAHISEKDIRVFYPRTIAHWLVVPHPATHQPMKVAVAEHELIRQLAAEGDCVIVCRCADIVCRDMHPFNIFVYADRSSKLQRCQERATINEHFSEKEMLRRMKQIDKERAAYRGLFIEDDWGQKESYHLCVNTSGKDIKAMIPAIAEYAKIWFAQN